MNIPNKLTVLRIVLVPFFMFFLLCPLPNHFLFALIIFALAAITDHFDGKIARANNLVTDFGKFADPLADKVLVMAAFMSFVQLGLIGATVVVIMISREFIVTSIRLIAASSGKVIAANIWGKIKTVSQMIAIISVIVSQILNIHTISYISVILVWFSAILTLISGIIYIKDNVEFIKNTK